MLGLFCVTFSGLVLTELVKGLSANGTPPVLQKYPWQLDLAHFMWSNIRLMRAAFVIALVVLAWRVPPEARFGLGVATVLFGLAWWGVYWVFNRFWVGKYKFLPITQKVFAKSADNAIDLSLQVIGVDLGGVQKAYPANMLFYHHQISDEIGGQPIWVTYCGLCRSGRVYDINVGGRPLTFGLIGAITFNAVFRDDQTGSWWRQETGEAVKGSLAGTSLADIPFEQMSLENWLAKHPHSDILQYDPVFAQKYGFTAKLLAYEVSLPGWHRQETPPLVIGVEVGARPHAYDFRELTKRRMVQDDVSGTPLLAVADADGVSAFVYTRDVAGDTLAFAFDGETLTDTGTGSVWNMFGHCISGPLEGTELRRLQSYQQFVRAWISFHPGTTFHRF